MTFILDDDNATDRQICRLLESKEIASRLALNSALLSGMTEGTESECQEAAEPVSGEG